MSKSRHRVHNRRTELENSRGSYSEWSVSPSYRFASFRGSFRGESRLRKPRALSEARTARNNHASFSFHQVLAGVERSSLGSSFDDHREIISSVKKENFIFVPRIFEPWFHVLVDQKPRQEFVWKFFSIHVRSFTLCTAIPWSSYAFRYSVSKAEPLTLCILYKHLWRTSNIVTVSTTFYVRLHVSSAKRSEDLVEKRTHWTSQPFIVLFSFFLQLEFLSKIAEILPFLSL